MKVSRKWLEKFFDSPLPDAQTLGEALLFHAFELEGIEQVDNDQVIDIKVLGNRGHDCLSHRGIAKELSAILKVPLTRDPFAETPVLAPVTTDVSVDIQRTPLCKRYIAGYVKGVKVGPSPKWLQERLWAIGQRSINNIVDATNFVMFNTGQPLHTFDTHKLGSLKLGVRLARQGEVMEALDQKKYTLAESMLVITAADTVVGIAGVKGGMPAAIDESTKDIVIESANFDGASVRKTAQALKLRTDASTRFEQELSPELAGYGMQSVVELIQKLAGGELIGFADVYPSPQTSKAVSVSVKKINRILGTQLTGADVSDAFTRLGFVYKEEGDVFEVVPPFERLDITIPEDLVEEVARIVGYDKILSVELPLFEKKPEVNENFYAAEHAREELIAKGYSEVFTSVFAEKGERSVANKVDGARPFLRTNLLEGLTIPLIQNIRNKDFLGLKKIKLFEIGPVWKGGDELTNIYSIEGEAVEESRISATQSVEISLKKYKEKNLPKHPEKYELLPISTLERYQPFSKYPYIVRDIAVWIPAGTNADEILEKIKKEAGELAVRVSLFDTFRKAGKISLAYRIVFQSFNRTLTEVEANNIIEKVSTKLKNLGFEIR